MTIYINARFLTQPVSGVQRFAHEILNALDQHLMRDQQIIQTLGPFVALCPKGHEQRQRWNRIPIRQIGRCQGHIWEQTTLNSAARDGLLVSLGNSGPLRHRAHLLAIHDANIWDIPNAFTARYRLFHKFIRPMLAKRGQGLISVSRFSANRLANVLDVPAQRFSIVPNGADHITKTMENPNALQQFSLRKDGFLLSVGNQSPNKNISRLIQAHAAMGKDVPPLAIVGGNTSGLQVRKNQSLRNVQLLGRVDDETLRSLYENAKGFVFPSLYEGFGIPPLESMLLGTPVLAAHNSALPEVLQDGAMWFDPLDVKDMTKSLMAFTHLSDDDRAKQVKRGREIANGFTWSKNALLLLDQISALKRSTASGVPVVRSPEIDLQQPIS